MLVTEIEGFRTGSLSSNAKGPVRVARWVDPQAEAQATLKVALSDEALLALESGVLTTGLSVLPDSDSLCGAIQESLAADPRPLYRWRRQQAAGAVAAEYELRVDGVTACCRFTSEGVAVVSLSPTTGR